MARISEQVLAGLARPAFAQGMFDLGAAIGNVPGQIQQRREQEKLAGFNPNTVEGLTGLAQYYQGQGDMQSAVKFVSAARELGAQQAEQQQLDAFKEQVAVAAENAGLTDQAATARATTDMDELRGISKDVREFQIEQLPLDNPCLLYTSDAADE